jgi:hypothetical protein
VGGREQRPLWGKPSRRKPKSFSSKNVFKLTTQNTIQFKDSKMKNCSSPIIRKYSFWYQCDTPWLFCFRKL